MKQQQQQQQQQANAANDTGLAIDHVVCQEVPARRVDHTRKNNIDFGMEPDVFDNWVASGYGMGC
jgi:hypothetical protein